MFLLAGERIILILLSGGGGEAAKLIPGSAKLEQSDGEEGGGDGEIQVA